MVTNTKRLAVFAMVTTTSALAQSQNTDQSNATIEEEEVIVTSLKRSGQSLLSAAAGISTISGDAIEELGADSLQDFLQLAPGASIDRNFGAGTTNIQVRGVNATFGAASVGFYLDDLPVSFVNLNFLPDPSPYDLKQVEVLKGPQGALYGAGSSGGVVLVRTNDPVLNEYEVKFDTYVSDTRDGGDNLSGSSAVNIPLVEDIAALRVSLSYQDLSGWIDDTSDPSRQDLNDEERINGRAKLLITPNDKLSLNFLAAFSRNKSGFSADSGDDQGNFPLSDLPLSALEPFGNIEYDQYGFVTKYDFPTFMVTNSFGYISLEIDQVTPFLFSIPANIELETYVNETRFNSTNDGPFSWVAGIYYRDSTQDLFQNAMLIPGNTPNVNDSADSEQYSAFGEVAYTTNKWELSIGGSYFEDDTLNSSIIQPAVPDPVINETGTSTFSPQTSLAYYPTEDSTIYARYAEGFRAANIEFGLSTFFAQQAVPSLTGRVDQEDINAFELGYKADFADGRVYFETALFYNEISDIQQSSAVIAPGANIPTTTILNAGDAESKGVEWLLRADVTDRTALIFSGSYTDAEIKDDFFPEGSEAGATPLFAAGTKLNQVPEVTTNVSLTHGWPLGIAELDATISLSLQYSSERPLTILGAESIESDEILRSDFRFEVGKNNWSVYFFADNITDEDGAVGLTRNSPTLSANAAAFGASFDGFDATRLRPFTIGTGIRGSFF